MLLSGFLGRGSREVQRAFFRDWREQRVMLGRETNMEEQRGKAVLEPATEEALRRNCAVVPVSGRW